MPINFACAGSHAPGIKAWAEAAEAVQRDNLYNGYARLRRELEASHAEILVVLTSEHWANFFLDHISAFCVGRGATFQGPIEPWLRVPQTCLQGDAAFADALIEALYENGFEPNFSQEMVLDHGTMVPLHFLDPEARLPIIPIMFNTLAAPQPSAGRVLEFGRILGEAAAKSSRRIGFVATGGLSHDPGERGHGRIDETFDQRFLQQMAQADLPALAAYTNADFAAAGAGSFELLAWIALAGVMAGKQSETVSYEAVKPWATGMGLISYAKSLSATLLAAA
jgi:aromatic ring-opening dioxygenase catalytic subunit (LigB family)